MLLFLPEMMYVQHRRATAKHQTGFLAPWLHTNTLLPGACRGTERQLGIVPVPEDRGQLILKQHVVVAMRTVGACVSTLREREREKGHKKGKWRHRGRSIVEKRKRAARRQRAEQITH